MEEWRDIPGYEGKYQVSDQGRVRSLDRVVRARSKAGKWYLRPVKGKVLAAGRVRGYLLVNIHPHGTITLHRLVARAFMPPPPTSVHEINHKDLDKHNNRLDNLEWVTRKENSLHWRTARGLV